MQVNCEWNAWLRVDGRQRKDHHNDQRSKGEDDSIQNDNNDNDEDGDDDDDDHDDDGDDDDDDVLETPSRWLRLNWRWWIWSETFRVSWLLNQLLKFFWCTTEKVRSNVSENLWAANNNKSVKRWKTHAPVLFYFDSVHAFVCLCVRFFYQCIILRRSCSELTNVRNAHLLLAFRCFCPWVGEPPKRDANQLCFLMKFVSTTTKPWLFCDFGSSVKSFLPTKPSDLNERINATFIGCTTYKGLNMHKRKKDTC